MDVSNGGLIIMWSLNASPSELWQHSLLRWGWGGGVKVHKAIGVLLKCHCCGGPDGSGFKICRGGCGCVGGQRETE